MDSASSDHIFNSFTPATKDDWLKAAQFELDGANPFQKLTSEKDGLVILPYYDEHDTVSTSRFHLKASSNEFLGARAWHNMPILTVGNESESNRRALSELNSGADGIILNITSPKTDITALLEGIEWPYCAISFSGNISDQFLNTLHDYAVEKKFDVGTMTGCVFRNGPFENEDSLKLFASWKNFHPLGIEMTKKESAAEEIASALAQAVKQIDFLTDKGLSPKQVVGAHAFYVPTGKDFFITIAKLKVLRMLWYNVAIQFGNQSPVPIFIHASSAPWIRKEYQPNSNLIKSTTAALSAVLGGCDALTIIPEESNNLKMERIARNVTSVLREEAQLARVADPTAGSYYLESLIDQLAEQAWRSFQKQVNV